MLGYAHLITGALSTTIAVGHGLLPARPEVAMGSMIGSLLVDIDEPHSKINQFLLPKGFNNNIGKIIIYGGLSIGCLYAYFTKGFLLGIPLGVFLGVVALSKHRGIIHSLLGLMLILGTLYYITPKSISLGSERIYVHMFLDSILFNSVIHLLGDTINSYGVKLLYPFVNKSFKLPFAVNSNTHTARLLEMTVILTLIGYIYLNKGVFA